MSERGLQLLLVVALAVNSYKPLLRNQQKIKDTPSRNQLDTNQEILWGKKSEKLSVKLYD